jgi:hypothetical protein
VRLAKGLLAKLCRSLLPLSNYLGGLLEEDLLEYCLEPSAASPPTSFSYSTLKGYSGSVNAVVFSLDGQLLALHQKTAQSGSEAQGRERRMALSRVIQVQSI